MISDVLEYALPDEAIAPVAVRLEQQIATAAVSFSVEKPRRHSRYPGTVNAVL